MAITNKIITISREYGSGGRGIGKRVAKQLNIKCYDEEIISEVARCSGLSAQYIREHSEDKHGGIFNVNHGFGANSLTDDIWLVQREIIIDIAKRESCVIVGRCADYILQSCENMISVFIHAPLEDRIRRISEEYKVPDKDPKKLLLEKDKRRRAYYKNYTDLQWGDASNYTMCLNSCTLGMDRCVQLIVDAYNLI